MDLTYIVTQTVAYGPREFDSPQDVLDLIASGDWDTSDNEVLSDRVQVYDGTKLVADSAHPELLAPIPDEDDDCTDRCVIHTERCSGYCDHTGHENACLRHAR